MAQLSKQTRHVQECAGGATYLAVKAMMMSDRKEYGEVDNSGLLGLSVDCLVGARFRRD